ncbi:aldehyde dehydrogenase [Saccharopolyspora sp. TS4A08]|uniref:aldehyde dehydrogenase (NAD(+)) n=1 Tax=Saccharopolyspora ipomoeae TaxID=3042027 RepID=A0ABT6PRW0_9PSEU|nr:aldehyde dehydrogenase [Saccharopolyspora sp. TS4A08]MDI2030176.1 aldehyde dehydrogenase [Saccharopolyspora sp. TS4A08]
MSTRQDVGLRSFSKLFIGGRWVDPVSEETLSVVSPSSEEVIATVPSASPADVDAAVAAARRAFDDGPWPRMSAAERAGYLSRIRDEVAARVEDMEHAFSAEVGAPAGVSKAFHQNALAAWDDAITVHQRAAFEEKRSWGDGEGVLVREPVGVVAAIIPWNGPVAQASMKYAPALAAGCTVVLKPSPEAPLSTLILAEAIEAAGLPEGVVSMVPAGREVGEHLVRHPDVDKVSFTGSTAAGKRIMSICGERIARVSLELGGKSAAIVADDVPVGDVVPSLVQAGVINSGQVCAALTRVLVPRHRQQEFAEAIAGEMESYSVGSPFEEGTDLGPLVSEQQRERVESYVRLGVEEGARLITGGARPEGLERGWYVAPTLFADVRNDMRIAREEIFGPVMCLIPFDGIDEAVAIANDSDYGLSGAVYAEDTALAERVARQVRTGQICINGWAMRIDQPFGGYKQSGLGREGNLEGLGAFLEYKLIQHS